MYRYKINKNRANAFVIIIFGLTTVLIYNFPGFTIIAGGFLPGIFLTTFIESRRATILAAAASIIILVVLFFLNEQNPGSANNITLIIFETLLIAFSAIAALYMKNLYRDIRSDKTHIRSLFENATEGILITNQEGIIVLANPAAEKTFGYNKDELTRQQIEILIPQKYRGHHPRLREGFHKAPASRVMGAGRDLQGTRKNGESFPVELSLSFYKQNNETYVIAFIVDITQRKEIENNMLQQKKQLEKISTDIRKLNTELEAKVGERTVILREALMKLEQSQRELSEALDKERELNEIKSRFVSMASHEFRTPLSTVLSSASLLGKYTTTEDQEKRNKHINRIKESVRQLNDILEDFLSLGKLDEGKEAAHPAEFDLQELIHDTIEEMKELLKNGQTIIYHHGEEPLTWSDKNLLKNILINLVSNASKFSAEGQPIEVTSTTRNGKIQISVADKGIGISPDDQEHLFTSFFRGKNAINIQGTGLGLHIVKRYVDLLGGDVHLQSELNNGTTITISIPVKKTI